MQDRNANLQPDPISFLKLLSSPAEGKICRDTLGCPVMADCTVQTTAFMNEEGTQEASCGSVTSLLWHSLGTCKCQFSFFDPRVVFAFCV